MPHGLKGLMDESASMRTKQISPISNLLKISVATAVPWRAEFNEYNKDFHIIQDAVLPPGSGDLYGQLMGHNLLGH